jgi:phosphoglycolate phosphatase
MLKLVVFDCDGVMFSSRESNRVYYNHLLQAFSCPPMDEEELNYVHIHNVNNSVVHIFRNHPQVALDAVNAYRWSPT